MNKYNITFNGRERVYRGNSAMQAMEHFERQNHVTVCIKTIDAVSRGEKVAAGYVLGDAPQTYREWVEMAMV